MVFLFLLFPVTIALCVGAALWRRKRRRDCARRGHHYVDLGGNCSHCGWSMF